MSMEIQVNYPVVSSKTAELRNRIKDEIHYMESKYRLIQTMLDDLDGADNATIKETMETNRQKIDMAAETLDKLILFMAKSSDDINTEEYKIADIYKSVIADMMSYMGIIRR